MKEQFPTILAALLAGTNIFQYVFWNASKTKAQAEADSVKLDNKQKALDIRQDAMKGIQQQCDDMMARMLSMQTDLQKSMIEVAELKALVVAKDKMIIALTEDRDRYKSLYEQATGQIERLRKQVAPGIHTNI